jgi:hypothetical protein
VAKRSVKKAAKKPNPRTPRPAPSAGPAPTPEVVAQ